MPFCGALFLSRHNGEIMPKLVPQAELDAVLQAVARFPEGASIEDIGGAIEVKLPRRTLQRRLDCWSNRSG